MPWTCWQPAAKVAGARDITALPALVVKAFVEQEGARVIVPEHHRKMNSTTRRADDAKTISAVSVAQPLFLAEPMPGRSSHVHRGRVTFERLPGCRRGRTANVDEMPDGGGLSSIDLRPQPPSDCRG